MALVAVVACTGGIESSEKSAEDTPSPYHGELIVFSLLRIACFRSPMSPAIARFRLPVSWFLSTNFAKARMLPRSGFVQRARNGCRRRIADMTAPEALRVDTV